MEIASRPDVDVGNDAAPTASSPSSPGRLFPELCDQIIDHLHDDHKTLATCALVSRDWTAAARYHRFRTLLIKDGIDDHAKLGEALSGSIAVRHAVRTLWLYGHDHQTPIPPGTPNMGPVAWLPVLDKATELILTMTSLDSSYTIDTYDYDLGPYLPALRRLRFYCLRLGALELGMLLESFPLVDTLVFSCLFRFIHSARSPQPPGSPPLAPPEILRQFDLHLVTCVDVERISKWLLRQPRPENLQVLRLKLTFYSFGHAQCLLDKFGPLCLVDLNHEIHGLTIADVGNNGIINPYTNPSLTRCTALRTLRIAISSSVRSDNIDHVPEAIACADATLSSMASPALETLVIEARHDLLDPGPADILTQLDWKSLAKTLQRPTFAMLSKVVIEGTHFPDDFLALLEEKCPELYRRELLSLVTTKVSASPEWLREAELCSRHHP